MTAGLAARFFDLDREVVAAPWALYSSWRDQGPVVELPLSGGWAVTDYDLAVAVLRDPGRWSSSRVDGPRPAEAERWTRELVDEEPELAELLEVPLQTLLALDPPDHTRLRRTLVGHLSANRIRALEPLVDAAVADRLSDLVTGEPVEAVAALARPVPARVVTTLLGVADGERERLLATARAASSTNPHRETRDELRDRLRAELELKRVFAEQMAAGPPEGSLLSALAADVEAGRLREREALGLCREIIVAGSETTADHLASLLLLVARDAGLLERLRRTPADRSALVEEALRLESPFVGFWRTATEAVTLGDVDLPAGAMLLVPYAALNRSDRFPSPERIDLDHASRRHLAFGQGIHFCVGAPLARLQGEQLLHALAERVERLVLVAEPSPEDFHPSAVERGLERLWIQVTPREA